MCIRTLNYQENGFSAKFCTCSSCNHVVDTFVNTLIIHLFTQLVKELSLKLLTISMGVLLYLPLNYLFLHTEPELFTPVKASLFFTVILLYGEIVGTSEAN